MELLGRDRRKTLAQIEAHLVAEDTQRARPRPVLLAHPMLEHMGHQIEILLHCSPSPIVIPAYGPPKARLPWPASP